MKLWKRTAAAVLAVLMVMTVFSAAAFAETDPCASFRDVDRSSWYHTALDYVVKNGLMGGTSKETFEPESYVSRAMTVQTFYAIAGKPATDSKTGFEDVPENAWFADAVAWAYQNKLAAGVSATSFRPNEDVTREQLAVFFKAFAGFLGRSTSTRADLQKYEDRGNIAGYAAEAMQWAVASGLITGRSATELVPKGKAKRMELAQILYRFMNRETEEEPTEDHGNTGEDNPPADTGNTGEDNPPADSGSAGENSSPVQEDGYLDVSDAYTALNDFRAESNVWYWNSDNTTKTVYNTDSVNNLSPLSRNSALEETAKIRAKEIAQNFSHTRPDGTICFTAYPAMTSMGENIAAGQSSVDSVMHSWKEDDELYAGQGHRRNMLSEKYNAVGIAAYVQNGVIYWVQAFGKA